ncbi:pantothenate kinase [Phycicoccus sp. SLBN-51]|nr:pantothenate kinase [Phycicoccus sp. SLBN-51]
MVTETSVDDLVELLRTLTASGGGRTMVGIVGAPGSGKSTLATLLAERLVDHGAVVVPFDGFHLANAVLERRGLQGNKGAMETFDLDGYAHLLQRLRRASTTVYAPDYDRSIEEPIAGAVAVPPSSRVVITEGNYLLADHPAARRAKRALDAVWYLDLDEDTRTERLVERHIRFGKTPAEARTWVAGSDQRNADLVARTREKADLVVRLPDSR